MLYGNKANKNALNAHPVDDFGGPDVLVHDQTSAGGSQSGGRARYGRAHESLRGYVGAAGYVQRAATQVSSVGAGVLRKG